MDFALAEPIKQTLLQAIALGDTGYANPVGLAEAFADFARVWFNWSVDPGRVVLVPDVMVGAAEVLRLTTEGLADLVMEIACGLHNLRVNCRHPFPTFDVLSLLSSG